MAQRNWSLGIVAAFLLLIASNQPGAGQTPLPPLSGGNPTEQRLQDLEFQNKLLLRQLEQMNRQLQHLSNRLEETAKPGPAAPPSQPPPGSGIQPTSLSVVMPPAAATLDPLGLASAATPAATPGTNRAGLLPDWDLLRDSAPSVWDPSWMLVQERRLNPIQPGQLGRPLAPEAAATSAPPAPAGPIVGASPLERRFNPIQPGQLGRPRPPESETLDEPEGLERSRVDLTNGVSFRSPDGTYRIEFHNLTQVDYRSFTPTGRNIEATDLVDTFVIPRERLYFAGDVGEHFTFYSVLNRGYGALDVLDAYIDTKIAPWLNVRFGRYKTPYSYEYYKVSEGDLIAPERSLFIGNLAGNRQEGLMAWGRFLNEQVEYAAGVFNGAHRDFTATNNAKSPFLFLNTRPFLLGSSDELRYLAFGGSMNYWRAGGVSLIQPQFLSTMNDQSTSATVLNVSPVFLKYNTTAFLNGDMMFWNADSVWFLHSLFLMGEYNGGYETYGGLKGEPKRGIVVPYSGWNVTTSYFLTGEQPTTRKEIVPLRDLRFADVWNHPGISRCSAGLPTFMPATASSLSASPIPPCGPMNARRWTSVSTGTGTATSSPRSAGSWPSSTSLWRSPPAGSAIPWTPS